MASPRRSAAMVASKSGASGKTISRTSCGAPQDVREIVLPEAPDFDATIAAERLGEAIRFRTITVAPGDPRIGQEAPWLEMQAWMEDTYSAFHAAAAKET